MLIHCVSDGVHFTGQQYATWAGPQSQGPSGSASNSSQSSSGGSASASAGYGGSGGFGFGPIVGQTGPYNETFRDPPSSVHTTQEIGVIERDFADAVNNAINFENVTNQNNIPYFPTGPNSNSYASTFVESLTGIRPEPVLSAPGSQYGQPSPNLTYGPSTFVIDGGTGSGLFLDPNSPFSDLLQHVLSK